MWGKYQKKYFGFDVVQKYNEYKMFISAEERTGAMSINTFEGMACGWALVAQVQPYYEEIGLKNITFTEGPKKFNDNSQGHFISHFTQWYLITIDQTVQDFIVEPKEVIAICWFSKAEIAQKLAKEPDFFIPNMPYYFQLFK